MKITEIKGNTIAILGFGKEGKSALQFLQKHKQNANITILDKNPLNEPRPNQAVITGETYMDNLDQFDTIIRSPGISKRIPQLEQYSACGGHITSTTNIFLEQYKKQTIGITGTKGKSTTTTLIYNILKKSHPDVRLVGNIGKVPLDEIENATKETLFVMELSSYQLDDTYYSPHIAVLLEVGQDHITYHGSLENYIQAKQNITKYQTENDILIFNPSHDVTNKIAKTTRAQKIHYGCEGAEFTYTENELFYQQQPILNFSKTKLIGYANHENAAAAATTAKTQNATIQDIITALQEFTPLEHRLEYVATKQGITFYNDSIATTPEATINALDALKNTVQTLICGGVERQLNYDSLLKYLATNSNITNLLLFPDTGERIKKELKEKYPKYYKKITIQHVRSMPEAVSKAYKLTQKGKTVLLSPAAASHNMFTNFEDRGNQFKKEIEKYT